MSTHELQFIINESIDIFVLPVCIFYGSMNQNAYLNDDMSIETNELWWMNQFPWFIQEFRN